MRKGLDNALTEVSLLVERVWRMRRRLGSAKALNTAVICLLLLTNRLSVRWLRNGIKCQIDGVC